jgi:glycosyltransferase involved in cell wall biosynthesis
MPDGGGAGRGQAPAGSIAYLLTGFPRLSETFIASEIHRLEQQGLPLRLFVLKRDEEHEPHPVVGRIAARPAYLPPAGPVTGTSLLRWLAAYLPGFLPGLLRVAAWRPIGLGRAARAAVVQTLRARRPASWPPKGYVRDFLRASALADHLRMAPDVRHLHAHFCHQTTTVAWLASLMTGVPFSFTAHARDLYQGSLNPAGLLPRKLRSARFAVTCTEASRTYLARMADGVPIHCVYHGLNADLERLLAEAPGRPTEDDSGLRALGVGRLVPKKGFDLFVEACALVRAQGIRLRATIVGEDGEHAAEVRQRIAARGLADAVALAGPLGQGALFEEYRRATVFCLPCRVATNGDRDGIPNVLVEAMACGLPVVTTGVSGIPELVIDGVTGLLVPPEDPAAVAAALLRLQRDPDLARRLGRKAQDMVRARFDGERLARRLGRLFWPLVAA